MKKRKLDKKKFNRKLSRRGEVTGKPGNFVLTSALIGLGVKGISAGASASKGKKDKEAANQEETDTLMDQGLAYQDQQQMMDAQYSQDVLSTYNPQGDAQMYARRGARMYEDGGKGDNKGTEDNRNFLGKGLNYITDFISRNNIVSPEKIQFAKDIVGIEDLISENTLTEGQKNELKIIVGRAQSAGRNYVKYEDYGEGPDYDPNQDVAWSDKANTTKNPDDQSNKVFNLSDSAVIKRLLGQFSFDENEDGTVTVNDQYDWDKRKTDPKNLGDLYSNMKKADRTPVGIARPLAEYFGSNEGEGSIARINLDMSKDDDQESNIDIDYKSDPDSTSSDLSGRSAPEIPKSSGASKSMKISRKGDPYEYKYDKDTGSYYTKKKTGKNWTTIKEGSGSYDAISELFPKQEAPVEDAKVEEEPTEQYTAASWFDTATEEEQDQLKNDLGYSPSAKNGAALYKNGGKNFKPYPYQDQNQTLGKINPTIMFNKKTGKYQKGGSADMDAYNDAQRYYSQRQHQMPNSKGKISTFGEIQDGIMGMPEGDKRDFEMESLRGQYKERMGRLENQYGKDYVPDQYSAPLVGPDNMNIEGFGSRYSQFENRMLPVSDAPGYQPENPGYRNGGNMYDRLQGVSMQEYQQYQQGGEMPMEEEQMQGGATQVPGGEIQQVSDRAQVVKGDNPELIDDVELGTNPGEPDAVVDDNEVMVDAIDEEGQPYKQIFSDTVLVPGKNVSMAKEAKKLLAQMPEDEESEQAQLLYKKLDDLFNIQQMMNGDSEGETAEEAAQGGMDPNAAMQMGEQMPPEQGGMPQQGGQMQGAFRDGGMGYVGPSETMSPDGLSMSEKRRWGNLSQQRYQSGGAGYPSAGYQAGLQEQQMQAPYNYNPVVREQRPASYQGGGFLSGVGNWLGKGAGTKAGSNMDKIGAGISGAAQGIVPGYTAGYAMTPNNDGYSNTAMGIGALAPLAGGMVNDFGTNYGAQQQANLNAEPVQNDTNQNITSSIDQASNAVQGQGYRTEPTEEEMYGGDPMNPQKFEDGGMMMMGEGPMGNTMMAGSMNMQDMYEKAKSFAEYYESTLKLPNTLSDMQASANPKGWGHMNESVSNRKHGHLMGRMHRRPQVDSTAVMSGSERGGPKPSKRKGYVMGGRLRYSMPLNKRSLTLTIL